MLSLFALLVTLAPAPVAPPTTTAPSAETQRIARLQTGEGDYVIDDFRFHSGETLPRLKMHYTLLGTPHRDTSGAIDNAVMILHGTGGTGKQFLAPQFADELYGPGQPLDLRRTFVILPDNLGHGASSKPSDGLRAQSRATITTTWSRGSTGCSPIISGSSGCG
jgi:homoserine O-acetyltransferase/O-succinyltransferase